MARTGSSAAGWASQTHNGYGGLCLQFVRLAFGVPAKYASAALAWQKASKRHKTSSTAQIPANVPIFFSKPGHPYGHVGLYLGGGKMATTHASTNKTGVDKVSTWTGSYGYHLLGWTEDLNGVTVYKPKPASKTSKYKVTAKAGVNVRTKPSTSAKIVSKLAKGKTFTVPKGSGTVKGSGHRWLKSTAGHFVAYEYTKKVS